MLSHGGKLRFLERFYSDILGEYSHCQNEWFDPIGNEGIVAVYPTLSVNLQNYNIRLNKGFF